MRDAKDILVGLATSEHMGDVGRELADLAELLGEQPPTWSDRWDRFVFPWEAADLELELIDEDWDRY